MDTPTVSILMTAHNRENYIAASIESALNSTYTNFELIIVDDASTDKTVRIAASYAEKDARIKLVCNSSNLGQFKNRNYVASLASGRLLKFLDSDDLLYPTGLEVLVNMIDAFPDAGYGLCSIPEDIRKPFPFKLGPEETYEYHFNVFSVFHKAPLSSIIRKDAFWAVGGFDVNAVCGDFAFWLKIAQAYPVVLMPAGVAWYRVHEAQEMSKTRVSSVVAFEYEKILEYYLSHDKCPLANHRRRKELQRNKQSQLSLVIKKMARGRLKEAMALNNLRLRDAGAYFFNPL